MPTYAWQSPTGHTEPTGTWHNPARVYDGNWNNYADCEAHAWDAEVGAYPTAPLILTLAAEVIIDRVRFKKNYTGYVGAPILIDVWNTATSKWDVVLNQSSNNFAELSVHEILIAPTHTDKIRFRHCLSGIEIDLYELDVEVVTPDSPNVPVPPDPRLIVTQKITENRAPPLGFTRVRTVHRTTAIEPWIVS